MLEHRRGDRLSVSELALWARNVPNSWPEFRDLGSLITPTGGARIVAVPFDLNPGVLEVPFGVCVRDYFAARHSSVINYYNTTVTDVAASVLALDGLGTTWKITGSTQQMKS